jgi:hypothetical protein
MPRNMAHQAELDRRRGRLAEAAATAREALARFDRLGLAGHPSAVDARLTLGAVLLDQGRSAEAADALRPALAVATVQFVEGDARTRRLAALLGLAESRR